MEFSEVYFLPESTFICIPLFFFLVFKGIIVDIVLGEHSACVKRINFKSKK